MKRIEKTFEFIWIHFSVIVIVGGSIGLIYIAIVAPEVRATIIFLSNHLMETLIMVFLAVIILYYFSPLSDDPLGIILGVIVAFFIFLLLYNWVTRGIAVVLIILNAIIIKIFKSHWEVEDVSDNLS